MTDPDSGFNQDRLSFRSSLQELESFWSNDPDLSRRLRLGRSPSDVLAALADLGLSEPPWTLQEWFGWHDGCSSTDIHESRAGAASWSLLSLEGATRRYAFLLADARAWLAAESDDLVEAGWGPAWFPLLINGSGDTLAVDCDPKARPGAIHIALNTSEVILHLAPSLPALVELWLNEYRTGRWTFAHGSWSDRALRGQSDSFTERWLL